MKIIADENIKNITHYFGGHGELALKPGRAITRDDLLDADMLIVRAVTPVNQTLLANTRVKFVGTVTSGFDHLDTTWLDQAGIAWAAAEGCNTTAVAEYVTCVLAALQKNNFLTGKSLRAGVIGAGKIGRRVVDVLKELGFEVLQCDPLRAQQETDFHSTSIEKFSHLDFISIHTPLTKIGAYPTYHLIEKHFLARQKKDCVLLNTGRGAVVSFEDLKLHGQHLLWCLDVWENEPDIDFEILEPAFIATPHIAGYTEQSKYRGVEMIYRAAVKKGFIPDTSISRLDMPMKKISLKENERNWHDLALKVFDPLAMTEKMKETLREDANAFDRLRKEFVGRHEFAYVRDFGVN